MVKLGKSERGRKREGGLIIYRRESSTDQKNKENIGEMI